MRFRGAAAAGKEGEQARPGADAPAGLRRPPLPAGTQPAGDAEEKKGMTPRERLRGFALWCVLLAIMIAFFRRLGPAIINSEGAIQYRARRDARNAFILAERDVAALDLASTTVAKQATLPTFSDLMTAGAQLGGVYAELLKQISTADEGAGIGAALNQFSIDSDPFTLFAVALRRAADVGYGKLKAMLLQEPNAELHLAPTSLVRTMHGWLLSDIYLYSAVLPEYYLLQDDTANHAVALVRSVNLLSWSRLVYAASSADAAAAGRAEAPSAAVSYDIFNWSAGSACRQGTLGDLRLRGHFCESSFASWPAVARRVAATYEELIVMHSTHAPLRLHYAVAFTFFAVDTAEDTTGATPILEDHTAKALAVLRTDKTKLQTTYKNADAVHAPLLALLEVFLAPDASRTPDESAQLVAALQELKNCKDARETLLGASKWPGKLFAGEYRPPLLRPAQLAQLLKKAQVHLGHDHAALKPFADCM